MIERKNLEEQDIIELARENEQLKYQLQIIHANLIRVEQEQNKRAKAKIKRLPKHIPLTGKIYKMLMREIEGPSYRSARLRIGICLLTITGIRVNQLMTLKVFEIESLFKEGWVLTNRVKPGPGNRKAFLNMEGKRLVREREKDFKFVCSRKQTDSYIFTSEYNHSKPLTRETLTKGINLVVRQVSEEIPSKPCINSHSFRVGYIQELWKDSRDIEFVKQSITTDKLDFNFEKAKSG